LWAGAEVALCGEGPTDIAVARRLLVACGGKPGVDLLTARAPRGKAALDKRLPGLNAGARYRPTLVLRDLDTDAACAGALVLCLLPDRESGLCLRIAVPAVEAWLMADRAAFARAAGVRVAAVPGAPEQERGLKSALDRMLATSADPQMHERFPDGRIEPQLRGLFLSDFARDAWDPGRARSNAPSLARAMDRLAGLCRD
jgi:hypothetical protein